ncbi:MAG: nucleotidyltransferase family protein [Planctomycetes bacterium]|jgi:predicted nucleotidyltransferase|nr:nucleotidyltransferase family protein [Planctomycetota bacterium]
MVTLNDVRSRRDKILEIAARHGASRVRIFGSVSRGTDTPSSDIDLLVYMAPDRSLLDRIALIRDLEDLLHSSVDVVNERALHPEIRDEVLAEAVEL